jgi:HemY protein
LLALAAGDTADARRESGRARKFLGDTPQTLTLAAEAARLSGDHDAASEAFRALTARDDAAFLGYRGLLRQAMEREDWSGAADLARSAEAAHPGALWLRTERSQLALRTADWAEALNLADADAPKAALATAAATAESNPTRGRRLAARAFRQAPDSSSAALALARRLREAGRQRKALAILRRAWLTSPHPDLAEAFLDGVSDKGARLQAVRQLTSRNGDHLESRLLLARTMLDANEAAPALKVAEAARDSGCNQRRLWSLLADIHERLGETDAATDALRRAARASDDPAWRCIACGAEAAAWHPICLSCSKVGTITWSARGDGSVIADTQAVMVSTAATTSAGDSVR